MSISVFASVISTLDRTDLKKCQPSIISTNKALYPHFRDMMSKFSKLVMPLIVLVEQPLGPSC